MQKNSLHDCHPQPKHCHPSEAKDLCTARVIAAVAGVFHGGRNTGNMAMPTIQIKTSIPGPKSRALAARARKPCPEAFPTVRPSTSRRPKAHGSKTSTATATSTSPEASDASTSVIAVEPSSARCASQLDRFMHTCVQVTPYEGYVRLAERMNEVTPGKFPKKTLFVNSGAEAVENAVKIARAYTKRPASSLSKMLPRPHHDDARSHQQDASL